MADLDLTQAEADALVAMEKFKADDQRWLYPEGGGAIHIPLVSGDKRETFFLDLTRSSIALTKGSCQCRGRQAWCSSGCASEVPATEIRTTRMCLAHTCIRIGKDTETSGPNHCLASGFPTRQILGKRCFIS